MAPLIFREKLFKQTEPLLHGRHFADDVQNGLFVGATLKDAIDQATAKWMGWTIGRITAKETGIPRGMAYLTGFVVQAAIDDELFA